MPFTNKHVHISDAPTGQLDCLLQETGGDGGYTRMDTAGARDWWAYCFDYDLTHKCADGFYIDEAYYGWEKSMTPVGRVGDIHPNGISYLGFCGRGMRECLKRLRQISIDHGRRPMIWLDASCAYVSPMVWAFADVVSDGEGVGFLSVHGQTNDWTPRGNNTLRFASTPIDADYIGTTVRNETHPKGAGGNNCRIIHSDDHSHERRCYRGRCSIR